MSREQFILLSGAVGTPLPSGYFWLASFNADATNIAIYEMAEVIAIPFGFSLGSLFGVACVGVSMAYQLIRRCFLPPRVRDDEAND